MNRILGFLLFSLFLVPQPGAHAYLTVLESGELVPIKLNRIGVIPQIVTTEGSGFNADISLDSGWSEATSSRVSLGAGKMDIHLGGSVKWVPYPDVAQQPALGVRGSVWYARYKEANFFTFSAAPLMSKKVAYAQGLFVPYVALPINYTLNQEKNFFSQQFVIGSEFKSPTYPLTTFSGELGVNLKDSYSFIAFLFSYQFDGTKGLPLK